VNYQSITGFGPAGLVSVLPLYRLNIESSPNLEFEELYMSWFRGTSRRLVLPRVTERGNCCFIDKACHPWDPLFDKNGTDLLDPSHRGIWGALW
jgi:hypothetical protein